MDSGSELLNKPNGGVVSKFLFSGMTLFIFFFLFWNVSGFGQTTDPNNLLPDKLTDKDWLTQVRMFGLSDDDVRSKLPILKSELDLTQDQTDEIEELISKMTDEEITANGLENDEEKVGTLPADEKKRSIQINNEHEQELKKLEIDVMNEVATVRNMLGNKDSDFRHWLIEEEIIYRSESLAYSKNHNYSPDDLIKSVVDRLQKSNIFKNIKQKKTKELNSEKAVKDYLNIKTKLIKQRVLLQAQLNGHLSKSYINPETPGSFREKIFNESEELGSQLRNIK